MRICGTIREAGSGRAIENLIVRAYVRDLLADESLGFATTRADGTFEIRPNERDAATPDQRGGLFVRVLDPTGEHEIYDTLTSLRRCDEPGDFQIAIPPENLGPRFERRDRSADTPQEFFQALKALTPRIFATPVLVFLNIAAFAWLVFQGASPISLEVATLIEWGANIGLRTLDGEWWRLVACLFLHGGILHLTLNCYILWVSGRVVERLIGPLSFIVLYFACGVLASLTSLAWNPFAASVGASGAIFGVWGALLGYALRQRDAVTLRGMYELRNNALLFLGANVLFGLTQENIDMAAHLGGLVAGVGAGLLLSQPVSLKARARRGARLALLCGVSVVLCVGFAAAIPKRVLEIQAELEEFDRTHVALNQKFSEAFSGGQIGDVRVVLEQELLPAWNQACSRLKALHGLPDTLQLQVDEALRLARMQEAEWRTLAGDFGRFQDALRELQELEDRATDSYERALAELQAGRLSQDEFVDVLYREVLAEWEVERKLTSLGELREPLQTLAAALQSYAATRENAWRLYAEGVRTRDAKLARASSEEHLRADSMIASWRGMQLDAEPPPLPAQAGDTTSRE